MKRVYMTFYREWYEAVSGLPEALRSEVLIAMIEYGLNGKVKGEMSPTAMVFFNMVKGKIDTNNKRYENGMKGGRPKTKTKPNHNQTETKQKPNHNQTETKQKPNHNQTETKTKPNHNQTETEIRMGENAENVQNSSANEEKSPENGKKTVKSGNSTEKNSTINGVKESSPRTPHKENNNINNKYSTEKDKEKKTLPNGRDKEEKAEEIPPSGGSKKGKLSLPSQSERMDYQGLKEYFNFTFKDKLAQITMMTESRKAAVKARVSEHGKDSIKVVFRKVLGSSFLMGGNDRNWRADFDWIFKPTNYIKILEGKYDNKGNSTAQAARKESVGRLKELAGAILTGCAPEDDQ